MFIKAFFTFGSGLGLGRGEIKKEIGVPFLTGIGYTRSVVALLLTQNGSLPRSALVVSTSLINLMYKKLVSI
ncbi:MAG: hypothetical protein EOP45_02705 [Sphingobacteriaceae bacterium]|nr:MAG: hypothetical protein EOP45_02705 [Sphingobacteriaceae bacterium]